MRGGLSEIRSNGILANWVAVSGQRTSQDPHGAGLDRENGPFRKETVQARMECDIPKTATAGFARESLPGRRP